MRDLTQLTGWSGGAATSCVQRERERSVMNIAEASGMGDTGGRDDVVVEEGKRASRWDCDDCRREEREGKESKSRMGVDFHKEGGYVSDCLEFDSLEKETVLTNDVSWVVCSGSVVVAVIAAAAPAVAVSRPSCVVSLLSTVSVVSKFPKSPKSSSSAAAFASPASKSSKSSLKSSKLSCTGRDCSNVCSGAVTSAAFVSSLSN